MKILICEFESLEMWGVKNYLDNFISKFEIIKLKDFIKEISIKENVSKLERVKILGVNNNDGIFDAYEEKGEKIKQKYKKIEKNYFSYNPYRVNVGSIDYVRENIKGNYISPAYVVFKIKDENFLNKDLLLLLLKSKFYNKTLRKFTRGSVRQILAYKCLEDLPIPKIPILEQNKIVKNYFEKIKKSENLKLRADKRKKEIEEYLKKELGLKIVEEKKEKYFGVDFKDLDRWDYEDNKSKFDIKSKFEISNIKNLIVGSSLYGSNQKAIKNFSNRDIRYVRITDIDKNDNLKNYGFVKAENFEKKYLLEKNDFLFARTGSVEKILRFKENYKSIFAGYLIKFNFNKKKIDFDYLEVYLKSIFYKKWTKSKVRKVANPNINSEEFKSCKIPLPPLPIQEKIVKHIDKIKNDIEEMEFASIELKKIAEINLEKQIENGV